MSTLPSPGKISADVHARNSSVTDKVSSTTRINMASQGRNQLFISWGQLSLDFIRCSHRAYSTVVQIFRKRHR